MRFRIAAAGLSALMLAAPVATAASTYTQPAAPHAHTTFTLLAADNRTCKKVCEGLVKKCQRNPSDACAEALVSCEEQARADGKC